jgi:lysophospholipid acyltransferase (LPLAT)-like uncharacterized protein
VKALLKSDFFQKIIVWVFLVFYTLLYLTWRKKVIYHPEAEKLVRNQNSFCIACWHQNNFTNIWLNKVVTAVIMASPSLEGKLIGLVMEKMGAIIAWGSSRKQPISGLKSLVRITKQGFRCPVITVDGPIGPRHKPKPGILEVSRLSNIPIVPLGTSSSNPWVLKKTWDLTEIPKPFSTVVYFFDKPLELDPAEIKSEHSLVQLAESINNAQRQSFENI